MAAAAAAAGASNSSEGLRFSLSAASRDPRGRTQPSRLSQASGAALGAPGGAVSGIGYSGDVYGGVAASGAASPEGDEWGVPLPTEVPPLPAHLANPPLLPVGAPNTAAAVGGGEAAAAAAWPLRGPSPTPPPMCSPQRQDPSGQPSPPPGQHQDIPGQPGAVAGTQGGVARGVGLQAVAAAAQLLPPQGQVPVQDLKIDSDTDSEEYEGNPWDDL